MKTFLRALCAFFRRAPFTSCEKILFRLYICLALLPFAYKKLLLNPAHGGKTVSFRRLYQAKAFGGFPEKSARTACAFSK
jgi:hypothetical protein